MSQEQHAAKLEKFLDCDGGRKLECVSREKIPEPGEDGGLPKYYADQIRDRAAWGLDTLTELGSVSRAACSCGSIQFEEIRVKGRLFGATAISAVEIIDLRCGLLVLRGIFASFLIVVIKPLPSHAHLYLQLL